MESTPILEITNLHKSFGDFKAVNNVNLHVNKGDIYGFLGPNGAGTVSYTHLRAHET